MNRECFKIKYATRAEATEQLKHIKDRRRLSATHKQKKRVTTEIRVYLCDTCRSWHTTKMKKP